MHIFLSGDVVKNYFRKVILENICSCLNIKEKNLKIKESEVGIIKSNNFKQNMTFSILYYYIFYFIALLLYDVEL